MKTIVIAMIGILLWHTNVKAQDRQLAITIDDLPFVGSSLDATRTLERQAACFNKIVQTLLEHQVPATGFVIAGAIKKGQWQLLETFRNQGFQLGNHTYTHFSLDEVSSERYIKDIVRADDILSPLMTSPKYFRYPYLAQGRREKKAHVYQFLSQHQFVIAPVTIDSKDYLFNQHIFATPNGVRGTDLSQLKKRYLVYLWQQTLLAEKQARNDGKSDSRQILLIHANLLNSQFLSDVISMYKQNGYQMVSLNDILNQTKALASSEYRDNDVNLSNLYHSKFLISAYNLKTKSKIIP